MEEDVDAKMHRLKSRPDGGDDPLLLPDGTTLYESLTTKFVNLQGVLQTLAAEVLSGYVRLLGSGVTGIILVDGGAVVESLCRADGRLHRGEPAMAALREVADREDGVLDIVLLEPDVVDSLHQLVSGKASPPALHGAWVNAPGLLSYLADRKWTGSLTVQSTAGSGVIMLREGQVTGAYTSHARKLSQEVAPVLELCRVPEALIEVRETVEPRPLEPARPEPDR